MRVLSHIKEAQPVQIRGQHYKGQADQCGGAARRGRHARQRRDDRRAGGLWQRLNRAPWVHLQQWSDDGPGFARRNLEQRLLHQ